MTDLVERLVPDELWVLFRRVVPPTEVIRPQGGGRRRAGDRGTSAARVGPVTRDFLEFGMDISATGDSAPAPELPLAILHYVQPGTVEDRFVRASSAYCLPGDQEDRRHSASRSTFLNKPWKGP